MAVLNKVDALSFTGGVGENSSLIREKTLENLEYLGIEIDKEKNRNLKRGVETEISASSSKIKVFVIPTDEEIVLTEDVIAVLNGKYKFLFIFIIIYISTHNFIWVEMLHIT